MKEYSIDFSGASLNYLTRSMDDENKWEGSINFINPVVVAAVTIKPQTKNWWRDLANKVGGEFQKSVYILIPPAQICPACNGMGIIDSAHSRCFYCKGDGEI